jgi:hypothetical protein
MEPFKKRVSSLDHGMEDNFVNIIFISSKIHFTRKNHGDYSGVCHLSFEKVLSQLLGLRVSDTVLHMQE